MSNRKRYFAIAIVFLIIGCGIGTTIGHSDPPTPTLDPDVGIWDFLWVNTSVGINTQEYWRNGLNFTAWIESISGGGGVTDHGALTGLGDDDHSLYLLQSGAEGLTGDWDMGNYDFTAKYITGDEFYRTGGNYTAWIESISGGEGVTDHGDLTGLGDDDHTQYLETGEGGVSDHGALTGLTDDDHSLYLLQDGSEGLTDNWDAGSFNITADNFTATDFYLESVGNLTAWVESEIVTGSASGLTIGAYDYNIYLNSTDSLYYAYNKTGSVVFTNADAITILQAVYDIDTKPKTTYLSSDFDADGDTLVITYSGTTLMTDGQTHLAGKTWTTPRITAINITSTNEHVKNTRIEGLNLRSVMMDTLDGDYNIAQVWIERSAFWPRDGYGNDEQGIRILGTDTSNNGYVMFVHITDVKINDDLDTTISDSKGAFSVESPHDGNGQYYFTRYDYKVRDSNTVAFGASGRTILFTIDRMSYVNLQSGNTGSKVVQVWGGGRFTDMKITNSLFELHYAQDIFQIDDGNSDSIILNCLFMGNTFSLSNDQNIVFIDDNADLTDWVTWTFSGIYGSYNLVKLNAEHFSMGDGGNARFNVTMTGWMYGPS